MIPILKSMSKSGEFSQLNIRLLVRGQGEASNWRISAMVSSGEGWASSDVFVHDTLCITENFTGFQSKYVEGTR